MKLISGAKAITDRRRFYLLSFTWGLLMNLGGLLVAAAMLLTGHKLLHWGPCFYFECGKCWGGMDWGIFFVVDRDADAHLKNHEMGHAMQNCRFGPLMPFLVGLPSSTRWWYRRIREKLKLKPPAEPYEAVWFEKQATELGFAYQEAMAREHRKA